MVKGSKSAGALALLKLNVVLRSVEIRIYYQTKSSLCIENSILYVYKTWILNKDREKNGITEKELRRVYGGIKEDEV